MQTFILRGVPFTITVTFCILGAHDVLCFLLEWLTKLPDITPFLQISQNLLILYTSLPPCSSFSKHGYYNTLTVPMQVRFTDILFVLQNISSSLLFHGYPNLTVIVFVIHAFLKFARRRTHPSSVTPKSILNRAVSSTPKSKMLRQRIRNKPVHYSRLDIPRSFRRCIPSVPSVIPSLNDSTLSFCIMRRTTYNAVFCPKRRVA